MHTEIVIFLSFFDIFMLFFIHKFQFISKDKNFEFIVPLWMLFEEIFLRNSPIHQVSGGGFDKSKIRQAAYDSMYGKLSYY